METLVLSGRKVSKSIRADLKEEIKNLPFTPSLSVILVGGDSASEVYVAGKEKACKNAGVNSVTYKLSEDTDSSEIEKLIEKLNNDPEVDGILLQLPLPKHCNENKLLLKISREKDVDGFHPYNQGKILLGEKDGLIPCTPNGVMEILKFYKIDLTGKKVVIVGRSTIVGRPLAGLMITGNATITVCHTKTKNLKWHVENCDILVLAAGKRGVVEPGWVNDGSVVIDVGIHRLENGKLGGDMDYDEVFDKVSAITPVPGGVGPMTITMLLKNTIKAAKQRRSY
jgi:methylenetetrahydrofolate dehydrogenase (NADP+) / methenyltetrahydrofolate cyclohydrolase